MSDGPTMAYIAHPIGGAVEENIEDLIHVVEQVHTEDTYPMAPYRISLEYLDDDDPDQRRKGIEKNIAYFERGWMDECWLTGPTLSTGMREETLLAAEYGIPIKVSPRIEGELEAFLADSRITMDYETLPESYTAL